MPKFEFCNIQTSQHVQNSWNVFNAFSLNSNLWKTDYICTMQIASTTIINASQWHTKNNTMSQSFNPLKGISVNWLQMAIQV